MARTAACAFKTGHAFMANDSDAAEPRQRPGEWGRERRYLVVIEAKWKAGTGDAGRDAARAWSREAARLLAPYQGAEMTHAPDGVREDGGKPIAAYSDVRVDDTLLWAGEHAPEGVRRLTRLAEVKVCSSISYSVPLFKPPLSTGLYCKIVLGAHRYFLARALLLIICGDGWLVGGADSLAGERLDQNREQGWHVYCALIGFNPHFTIFCPQYSIHIF